MTSPLDQDRNTALLAWYAEGQRELPWRDTADPYRVLVSEVMLQQTQAARVIPYYETFIETFPNVDSLAAAPLGDVLTVWTGLGYNGRARRLRDAARIIAADGWPDSVEELRKLPGVGHYTATAIASFAFGDHVVTIDTNVRRVISRWNGEPLDGAALQAATEAALGEPAADWNQALMDLGASLCLARSARCGECPVADWCAGPESYVPTAPQARFEGSNRQLRGAIVRAVVASPRSAQELASQTGFSADEVDLAIEDLVLEGLLATDDNGGYRVAE